MLVSGSPKTGEPVFFKPGALAQLVERLHGMQEVSGSNPLCSTKSCQRLVVSDAGQINTLEQYLIRRSMSDLGELPQSRRSQTAWKSQTMFRAVLSDPKSSRPGHA